MVKILCIVPSFPCGGAELQLRYFKNYSSNKIDVKILSLTESPTADLTIANDLMLSNVNNKPIKMMLRIIRSLRLSVYLLTRDVDVLMFYNRIFLPVAILLRFFNKKVIFSVREYDESVAFGWRKYSLSKMNRVYANSARVTNLLNSVGVNCNLIKNYFPFDETNYEHANLSEKTKFEVVVVANIQPHKNIEIVIQAASIIGVKVIIFGREDNEEYCDKLKALANDTNVKVEFGGFKNKYIINERLKESVCLIHPSLKEGTPNSVLEAINLGVPILLSKIPEHEALCLKKNAYFNPLSAKNLSEKIEGAQNNPSDFTQNRETLKREYGIENIKQIEALVCGIAQ
ncbi:glycosyltransferase family 4 protein [Alteromonas gracilis]|uniref:glycosyltransferase family 4 protein n=1 Tax=Alteromonas gracilis TaxID=1479524 RepID=UPI002FE4245A